MFGIIGNGSWATALAKMLTDNGNTIHWWMRNQSAVQHLIEKQHNQHYLTSVTFKAGSTLPTTQLDVLIKNCDTLIFCIPSAYASEVLQLLMAADLKGKKIISAIKGILPGYTMLLNDYLEQHLNFDIQNYVAITGPCHAEEVAQERLSYLTFSGLQASLTQQLASNFTTEFIRTTTNNDLWGAQYAAVLKNIYAVGAGIAHGLGYGDNFLSVYNTNCYREMYLFLQAQFEKVHPAATLPDFHTSAYLGDLLVTCYSLHSRNRTFGAYIGKGYSVKTAIAEMNMVAEGYYAVRGMNIIAKQLQISMPISNAIHSILWQEVPAATAFKAIEEMLS